MGVINDHEFYCSNYAVKEQPHIEGLLQTLADGVARLDFEVAKVADMDDSQACMERGRRVLHRLLSSTNRRMHKGFPEMLSYLLWKPSFYASHVFTPCYLHVLRILTSDIFATYSILADLRKPVKSNKKLPHLSEVDYAYRSERLERFPYYFLSRVASR